MNVIDGYSYKNMLAGGAKALEINRPVIDELNVFPVPDGDTGTNMSLTMAAAMREIAPVDAGDLGELAVAFSKGALKGARGNSGVILSQILKGFAIALDAKVSLDKKTFAAALKCGTEIAYSAVTKPKEGTILTVVRVMAETAAALAKKRNTEFEEFFREVINAGETILQKTPEMLPVLAKAGVVDAGGRGLVTIMEGMYAALTGAEIPVIDPAKTAPEAVSPSGAKEFVSLDNDYENITFQYCTEYFITHLKTAVTESDIDKYRDYLMTIGDCVLVIGDLDLVKTHVHTNNPDLALKAALKLGELDSIKIENMMEQHRKIVGEREAKEGKAGKKELKPYAMIAVCAGEGMKNIFKDLLVDVTIEGGQTMNPSVYDILNAINGVRAQDVFVLPNNSNIILAAQQAKELADVNVHVIPTTCMPEGIAAAIVFSPDASPEENYTAMSGAFSELRTAEVTHAVRSTRMNGFSVKEGDIIGICNKKIVAKSASISEAALATVEKIAGEAEMLTIYYGADITETDAERLVEKLEELWPDLEIAAYYGGQPHYYYLLSAE